MEGAAVELEGWGITVAKVDIMFIISWPTALLFTFSIWIIG